MDGIAKPTDQLTAAQAGKHPHETEPAEPGPTAGEGGSPSLTLDGFSGPLEHLLALARSQKIDLAEISLAALIDQLVAALRQAPMKMPLGQKGDWVVMAAWLVQLRSRLLLAANAPVQQAAATEVDQLRTRLVALEDIQALAGWLEHRPQLGHDVFARGAPEIFGRAADPPSRAQSPGVSADAAQAIDVIEFLWASLALFDDDAGEPDTTSVYRPPLRPELHTVADARARILRRLAEMPEGGPLDRFLPEPREGAGDRLRQALRQRSAWSSTFFASLELARQGEAALWQEEAFAAIYVGSEPGPDSL